MSAVGVVESTMRASRPTGLRSTRSMLYFGLGACVAAQLLIDASMANIACASIIFVTAVVTIRLLFVRSVIQAAPLPFVCVFGFNVGTLSGALVVQTLSFRAVDFNLREPVMTFAACSGFQAALLVGFFIVRHGRVAARLARCGNTRIVVPLGLMTMPSEAQLWFLGLVGCAALGWTATVMYTGTIQYGDVGSKAAFGFLFLAYAPYLIPLRGTYGRVDTRTKRGTWVALCGYTVVLIVVGILRNSRGAFATGVMALVASATLALVLGQLRLTKRSARALASAALVALLIGPALSDLSTAMIVVRSHRESISSSALLRETLETFQDKEGLERYRRSILTLDSDSDYDETYVGNPFFARFVVTKFFDNTLSYRWNQDGLYRDAVWRMTTEKLVALLPSPVLAALGVATKKDDLDFSIGDYLYYLQSGIGLGGHRTGSPVGHGLALFGGFFFLAAVPIYVVCFCCLQCFVSRSAGKVLVSPLLLMQMMTAYFLAAGDSLLIPIEFMLRGLPQAVVVYVAVRFPFRLVASLFNASSRRL